MCTSDVRSQQSSLFRSREDRDFFVCGSASIFRQFPCVMGTCETRRRHRRRFCGLLKKSLEKTLKKDPGFLKPMLSAAGRNGIRPNCFYAILRLSGVPRTVYAEKKCTRPGWMLPAVLYDELFICIRQGGRCDAGSERVQV